jgi:hypothetical protein
MKLSARLQEFAERNYQLKARQIEDEHRKREREIPANSLTPNGESLRVVRLLPLKLRAKGQAVIDCYFEAFELEGSAPKRDDQVELDKKLENIFRGGFGDYNGSLGIGVHHEIQGIEKELCELMRLRAERMALQLERGTNMDKLKIRWSQLPKITQPGIYRVPGVGDVDVTAEAVANVATIGGDPWIELHDTTTFGSNIRQYTIGLFTPA